MTFREVEEARKNYWEATKKYLFISGGAALIVLILSLITGPLGVFAGLTFGVIILSAGIGIGSFLTNKHRLAYRKAYKGYFVEQNLRKIFTHVSYSHEQGFSPDVIKESGMMHLADRFYSNDTVIAKYQNIPFAQADVTLTRVYTDDKGNTHEYNVFKGRYMVFEFPKKFDYRLEVIGKKFKLSKVPGKFKNRKMTEIETESPDFNRNFRVYGDDGFESFYLLAPDVIAKIEDIAVRYNYKLLLGFYDHKLVVALDDGKDAFEPPKFSHPLDEKTEMKKVAEDIKVITDFVDVISSH